MRAFRSLRSLGQFLVDHYRETERRDDFEEWIRQE